MSMLSDFDEDCPLTVTNLVEWLRTLVTELDKAFTIDATLLKSLYSKQVNSSITSVISATAFNEIVDAIAAGKELKCSDRSIGIAGAKYKLVSGDDYSSFEICVVGVLNDNDLQQIVLGAENLGGAIRLYKKTVTSL